MEIKPKKSFEDRFPTASVKLLVGSEEVKDKLLQTLSELEASEELRLRNEEIRDAFEMGRQRAEDERVEAEGRRFEAETWRMGNEADRISAEQGRKSVEKDRVEAERLREDAEHSRYLAEIARVNAERLRDEAYKARVANDTLWEGRENKREARETDRIQKDGVRESNETTRKNNESTRIINESGRVMKEKERVNAEILRQADYENWKEQVSEYSTRISNNAQEIQDVKETTPKLYGVNRYEKTVELRDRNNEVAYPITRPYAVIDENGKNLTLILDELSKSGGGGLVATTYAELWDMRDRNGLTPGTLYRITDYEAYTTMPETIESTHQFDLIVLATSTRDLSEECRAVHHAGDQYFAKSNLSAWRVWYSIDNDTNRFAWADENGKGVIYRLIDEWGNDCPYDFKNIRFKRYRVEDDSIRGDFFTGRYIGVQYSDSFYPSGCSISESDYIYAYTFHDDLNTDIGSDNSITGNAHGNIIEACEEEIWVSGGSITRYTLPNIVFGGRSVENKVIGSCHAITLDICSNNEIERSEYVSFFNSGDNRLKNTSDVNFTETDNNNIQSGGCIVIEGGYYNTIEDSWYITLDAGCCYNSVGEGCRDIYIGVDCVMNKFGKACRYTNLVDYSCRNTIGDGCYEVYLNGSENTIGRCCQSVFWDGENPVLGCSVGDYNAGIDLGTLSRHYVDEAKGQEVRLVYYYDAINDLTPEDVSWPSNQLTIAFYETDLCIKRETITQGVAEWTGFAYCYTSNIGEMDVSVLIDENGKAVIKLTKDISGIDREELSNDPEWEIEIGINAYDFMGNQLFPCTPYGISEDESLYGFVYVENPFYY